jgi:hypothetical protein
MAEAAPHEARQHECRDELERERADGEPARPDREEHAGDANLGVDVDDGREHVHCEKRDREQRCVAVQRRRHEQARARGPPAIACGDSWCKRDHQQQGRDDAARAHQVPDRGHVCAQDPPDCATGGWTDCCGADDGVRDEPPSELGWELTPLEDEAWLCTAASPPIAPVAASEAARSQRVTVRMRRASSARLCV